MQLFPMAILSAATVTLVAPLLKQRPTGSPLLPPDIPETLTMQNWTPDYRAFRIQLNAGQSGYFGMDVGTLAMLGAFGHSDPKTGAFLMDIGFRWTRGDKVQIDGVTFLVSYKADVPGLSVANGGALPVGETVALELDLIRSDSILEIQPAPDTTKDRFLGDLKAAGLAFSDSPVADIPPAPSLGASEVACLSNAKQIDLALIMYTNDYDDMLPYAQSTGQVQSVTMPYTKSSDVWKTLNPNGSQFRYNISIGGATMSDIENPAGTPAFFEDKPWPDGTRVIAYADGHAKRVDGMISSLCCTLN